MFFEEESKDTHGNMDDYDLNFEQDESVSWDKLLDDTESADEGLDLASEEKAEADDDISIADDLLDMDDESFDNFIQEQKQNIIKNREESGIDDLSTADDLKFDISQEDDDLLIIPDSEDELVLEETVEEVNKEVAPQEETIEVVEEVEAKVEEIEVVEENTQAEVEDTLELESDDLALEETVEEVNKEVAPQEETLEVVEESEAVEETVSIDDFLLEDVEDETVETLGAELLSDLPDESTNNIEAAFGVESEGGSEEEIDLNDLVGESSEEGPKEKKTSPILYIVAGVAVVFLIGFFVYTNVLNKQEDTVLESDNTISTVENIDIQTQENTNADITGLDNAGLTTDTVNIANNNDVVNVKVTVEETAKTPVIPNKIETKKGKKETAKAEKVTLKVVDSGRQTPFVPVAGVNNLGFATSPKIEIAKPFNTLAEPDPMFDKLVNITVSGILYDGSQNPSAVINLSGVDYFVQKGDKVDTFTVIGITKDTVVIKEKNNVFSATIGQNFTSMGSIDGEIQTVNLNNRQIQRLYKTYGEVNNRQSSNEYESLDEIEINTK